jgi:Helix-hairpin-helix motif
VIDHPVLASATRRRRLKWWWLAVPVLTFGFASWVPPLYVAVRYRKSWQFLAAGVWFLVGTAVAVAAGADKASPSSSRGLAEGAFVWALFFAGTAYTAILCGRSDLPQPLPAPMDSLQFAMAQRELRNKALEVVHRDPHLAVEAGIGRPDLPTHYADGGLVDINRASTQGIETLPGIDSSLAEKIVARRVDVGGFTSAADLTITFDLPPTQLDDANERLLFIPL